MRHGCLQYYSSLASTIYYAQVKCNTILNESEVGKMSLNKVVLLACGSFNPPTNMHLRMFELAKDHLHRLGNFLVVGGFISPVHDSYGKADLVGAKHRLAMLQLSLDDNSWINVSDWETKQETWTRTRQTLSYHQNAINAKLNLNGFDANSNENDHLGSLLPDNYRHLSESGGSVQVKLLCGADLLESFGTPGLWANEDIEAIVGQYGLVVITRENTNPLKFIYNSDILTKYMGNIIIVTEWITNEVSSTKIRRALRRSESVKYLIPDKVIDYIQDNTLFGTSNKTKYLMPPSFNAINNHNLLTPSPTGTSDMSIDTPSPMSCMNLCNNNLFTLPSAAPAVLSIDVPDGKCIITPAAATGNAKTLGGNVKHPGQAVKIVTMAGGAHTLVKEVRTHALAVDTGATTSLKNSKSCTELAHLQEARSGDAKSTSRSNDDLVERKSCDENLIKFIFTKHGIQVISDVETIV